MSKPKLTDPREFAIIRAMYFEPAEPRMRDIEEEELNERLNARLRNNNNAR